MPDSGDNNQARMARSTGQRFSTLFAKVWHQRADRVEYYDSPKITIPLHFEWLRMADQSESLADMQILLERFQAGDDSARNELINGACTRMTRLARKMLRDYANVRRWEDTGDVCQNASLRLWNALTKVTPQTLPDFYRLAALYIRRELIDLARSHYGPEGLGANHASQPDVQSDRARHVGQELGDLTYESGRLAAWTEFHEQIEALPEEDREIFDLLWYQELTQGEAAALLQVSERTIRRRWRFARVRIHDALKGLPPVSWSNQEEA